MERIGELLDLHTFTPGSELGDLQALMTLLSLASQQVGPLAYPSPDDFPDHFGISTFVPSDFDAKRPARTLWHFDKREQELLDWAHSLYPVIRLSPDMSLTEGMRLYCIWRHGQSVGPSTQQSIFDLRMIHELAMFERMQGRSFPLKDARQAVSDFGFHRVQHANTRVDLARTQTAMNRLLLVVEQIDARSGLIEPHELRHANTGSRPPTTMLDVINTMMNVADLDTAEERWKAVTALSSLMGNNTSSAGILLLAGDPEIIATRREALRVPSAGTMNDPEQHVAWRDALFAATEIAFRAAQVAQMGKSAGRGRSLRLPELGNQDPAAYIRGDSDGQPSGVVTYGELLRRAGRSRAREIINTLGPGIARNLTPLDGQDVGQINDYLARHTDGVRPRILGQPVDLRTFATIARLAAISRVPEAESMWRPMLGVVERYTRILSERPSATHTWPLDARGATDLHRFIEEQQRLHKLRTADGQPEVVRLGTIPEKETPTYINLLNAISDPGQRLLVLQALALTSGAPDVSRPFARLAPILQRAVANDGQPLRAQDFPQLQIPVTTDLLARDIHRAVPLTSPVARGSGSENAVLLRGLMDVIAQLHLQRRKDSSRFRNLYEAARIVDPQLGVLLQDLPGANRSTILTTPGAGTGRAHPPAGIRLRPQLRTMKGPLALREVVDVVPFRGYSNAKNGAVQLSIVKVFQFPTAAKQVSNAALHEIGRMLQRKTDFDVENTPDIAIDDDVLRVLTEQVIDLPKGTPATQWLKDLRNFTKHLLVANEKRGILGLPSPSLDAIEHLAQATRHKAFERGVYDDEVLASAFLQGKPAQINATTTIFRAWPNDGTPDPIIPDAVASLILAERQSRQVTLDTLAARQLPFPFNDFSRRVKTSLRLGSDTKEGEQEHEWRALLPEFLETVHGVAVERRSNREPIVLSNGLSLEDWVANTQERLGGVAMSHGFP
jgi:hypothetical protein